MSINHDIKQLKKIYNNNKLVPFIGAGLSRPFNVPNWEELIIKLSEELIDEEDILKMVKDQILVGKYWDAIDDIILYSAKDEKYMQNIVVDIIKEVMIKEKKEIDNNYTDLATLEVPYYLTTNYDNLLGTYVDSDYQTTILSDINSSTQQLASENSGKRIFHLHGDMANSGSIVLSRQKYKEVYNSNKYRMFFNFFRSGYTFLFIGFSFSDEYIIDLMNTYKEYFNDYHYILLANPTKEMKQEYMEKYKLIVVEYSVKNIADNEEHIKEIRGLIKKIDEEDKENF